MVSTFTPNIQLEEPARGDDVGTWDTPVNNNATLLDLVAGAITTIGLNNTNVVLSAAQFRSKGITFNSTLTGSVAITFPTSFTKSYEFFNACTGSSAFVITLTTTAAGGETICCPPGQWFECVNDGTNIRFKNFGGPIGSYFDYAGSSSPLWNDSCTKPPYIVCVGQAISSATYPILTGLIGTTAPDTRGRVRAALNAGTGRMTSGGGGVDGNTLLAAGGGDTEILTLGQIPTGITVAGNAFATGGLGFVETNVSLVQFSFTSGGATVLEAFPNGVVQGLPTTAPVTATSNNTGGAAHSNTQPSYIGGITLLRAA